MVNNQNLLDRFVNGESVDEIAADLGVSRDKISNRILRLSEIATKTAMNPDDPPELISAKTAYLERLTLRFEQETDETNAKIAKIDKQDEAIGQSIAVVILIVVGIISLFVLFSLT